MTTLVSALGRYFGRIYRPIGKGSNGGPATFGAERFLASLTLLSGLLFAQVSTAAQDVADGAWFERNARGEPTVNLYFYWSEKCPHCLEALPHVQQWAKDYPWLRVESLQLVGEAENIRHYELMAARLGRAARSVPAFVYCKSMRTGFDPTTTPQVMIADLHACHEHLQKEADLSTYDRHAKQGVELELPIFGRLSSDMDGLPYITLALAGVDAFNPCAFFVLMFLMSMLLHTRNRARMLLVGGVFVFFSGALYFAFMSAWLNLFRMIGQLELITVIAALVAIGIGLINVKDFLWFKQGVSLSIPDAARPALNQRVRNLLQARSLLAVLAATVGLSFFANLYEFLCTAGFPMVYTRILTLNELSTSQYYLYLLLYNLIYVAPLLLIVIFFVVSFGAHRLQERHGRALKLISGMMMLALGLVLLFEPNLLHNPVTALGVMGEAIALALLFIALRRGRA